MSTPPALGGGLGSKQPPKDNSKALDLFATEEPIDTTRNPSSDLIFLINTVVDCDNKFCPDLKGMYSDGVALLMQIKYPEMYRDLMQCTQQGRSELECSPLFVEGTSRVNPLFHQMVRKRRLQVQADPLGPNYDGILYNAPFWFEGAGEIWRRTLHGSKRTTIRDCVKLQQDSERCLNDPTKPTDYCFRLYGGATVCDPGTNCPYLHFPLLRCLQTSQGADFQGLNNCFKRIPNFEPCTKGFVKFDPPLVPTREENETRIAEEKAARQAQWDREALEY